MAVVPNNKAAKNLKNQYAQWLLSKGIVYWPSVKIYSWQTWINQCWQDCAQENIESHIVLTPLHRKLLWRRLIEDDIENNGEAILWNRDASVMQAIKAWQLVHDYQLDPLSWSNYSNDVAVFVRWYKQYDAILRQSNWLDNTQLIDIMVALDYLPACSQVYLLNFFQLNAIQQYWLKHCQKNSTISIKSEQIEYQTSPDQQLDVFTDFSKEIKASAFWAKEILEQKSDTSIAIVVPDLKNCASQVELIFRSVFPLTLKDQVKRKDAFQIEHNCGLANIGLVNSALNCLELLRYKFDYQVFSLFLRTPYLQDALAQEHVNALWDVVLRKYARPEESLSGIISLLRSGIVDKENLPSAKLLINRIQNLSDISKTFTHKVSPTRWCELFSKSLTILGWPDYAMLTVTEQQQLKQWDQLLTMFCSIGLVDPEISLPQALSMLNELSANSPLRQNADAHMIKIIDFDDAELACFDHAWVTGLTETVLPVNRFLNPLIPFNLQRDNKVLGSTNDLCNQQAQTLFVSLVNLSNETRFSYHSNNEESELQISPIVSDFNRIEHQAEIKSGLAVRSGIQLENYDDEIGLQITDSKISGGTYLLKAQALCPFQSYAKFRLNTEPMPAPQPGLDAAQRGALMHDVMFRIWRELGTQKTLFELNDEQVDGLINKHINTVIAHLDFSMQLFTEIERQRLFALSKNWLMMEYERAPFSVVHQEYKSVFNIDNFEIDIKIDRIDQLENQHQLIIDYKTGYASSSDWTSEKLLDPQLPIYYLALKDQVDGIAFAKTKTTDFDGISNDEINLKGIRQVAKENRGNLRKFQSWNELTVYWHQQIQDLINQYKQGVARVTPTDPNQICKQCLRQPLCRLYQHRDMSGNDDQAG